MSSSQTLMVWLGDVDVPDSNIAIIWTPILEWFVVRCKPKDRHQTGMMCSEGDWTRCSKYANRFNLDMLEWTYTTILMSTKNLHFENSYSRQGIHMSCADGYGHDLDLLPDYLALIAM